MKVDDVIRDTDRRHVLQLFDLICQSGKDPFVMTEIYCRMWERQKADNGEEYFILIQPIQILHRIEHEMTRLSSSSSEFVVDPIIFHWIAEVYLYALYSCGISFRHSAELVSPHWLYEHYSPLHEASLPNVWEKVKNR